MMLSSFHRSWAAGIDGNGTDDAAAIALSGSYEDDEDNGDEIIYTGVGGNDSNTGKQTKDQNWEKGNAGLRISMDRGLPVRVVRGSNHESRYSPTSGYQYAGLYSVVEAWEEVGKSGYKICRFRLEYSGQNPKRKTPEEIERSANGKPAQRKEGTILRIIRDTKMALEIKRLYDYKCQVCGDTIPTPGKGRYAEGAHIKPLGRPHNGDDSRDNLICLCPNHHVMFDKGSFSIADDFALMGEEAGGRLILHQEHKLNALNLQYHRKTHGYH